MYLPFCHTAVSCSGQVTLNISFAIIAVYLNPALLESEEAKAMCRLINSRLDPIMEQILGYQLLKC